MKNVSFVLALVCSVLAFTAGQGISDDDVDADYYFSRGQYYEGEERNYPEAAKWYRKAADLGHAGAQSSLSALYFRGIGVAQDDTEALKLARMAADQGYAWAQANIGYLHHHGRVLPQDHAEAEKWYLMAAKQGLNHHAMIQLAHLHDENRRYVKAIAWAWVAMTKAKNYDEEQSARDLRTTIARRDAVTNDDVDQAETLANSILQSMP